MRVEKSATIAGLPSIQIRKLLRRLVGFDFTSEQVAHFLNTPRDETKVIISKLEEANFVEKTYTAFNSEQFWKVTLKGSAFSLATAAKPIYRKTAKKNLEKFLERVERVNSDNYYLYKVTKVLVFGSYLSDKDRINDLDIAVELKSKISDNEERVSLENKRIQEAQHSGRAFSNFVDQMFWPVHEVLLFLKSRSRTISLHTTDDKILERSEYKIIFEKR